MLKKVLFLFLVLSLSIATVYAYTIRLNNEQQNNNGRKAAAQMTLGSLPAGTYVMDSSSEWKFRYGENYSGKIYASSPIIWQKLEDNHYVDGATLLLSMYHIANYPYNAINKGLLAWAQSDVRTFLRTFFYNHLSENFKASIVEVDIPYNDLQGKPATIKDNIFLLSTAEWGLVDDFGLTEKMSGGKMVTYDDLRGIYFAKTIKYNQPEKEPPYYYIQNNPWGGGRTMTRTINRPLDKTQSNYHGAIWAVNGYRGNIETASTISDNNSVRPAVNLKSTTRVEGPYYFLWGHIDKNGQQNKIEYYKIIY